MKHLFVWIETALFAITLMDGVDIAVKIVSALMAVIVGIFAIKHYNTRRKLDQIQIDREKEKIKSNGKV